MKTTWSSKIHFITLHQYKNHLSMDITIQVNSDGIMFDQNMYKYIITINFQLCNKYINKTYALT